MSAANKPVPFLGLDLAGHVIRIFTNDAGEPEWTVRLDGGDIDLVNLVEIDMLETFIQMRNGVWCSLKNLHRFNSNAEIRKTPEYVAWRQDVFDRDGRICQHCLANAKEAKKRGGLTAHHIDENPELMFKLWNGVTLCLECNVSADDWWDPEITSWPPSE